MKKIIAMTALALACGRLPAAKLCEVGFTGATNIVGTATTWSVTTAAGLTISGESACSAMFSVNTGTARITPVDGSGGACYCRMTAPQTGGWILQWNFGSLDGCRNANSNQTGKTCAYECLRYMTSGEMPVFKRIMLSHI